MPTLEELLNLRNQSLSSFSPKEDNEQAIVSDALASPVRPEYLKLLEEKKKEATSRPEGARSLLGTSSPEELALQDLNEYDRLRGLSSGQKSAFDSQKLQEMTKALSPTASPVAASSAPFFPTPTGAPIPEDQLKEPPINISGAAPIRAPTSVAAEKVPAEESQLAALLSSGQKQESQYEDLLKRYKEAQLRQQEMQRNLTLAQAGEKIGSAIAMVQPSDQSFYEQQMKIAGGITDQFKEEEAVRQEAEKNDPNSALSKQYQELVKSMGIPVKGNESAATLIKALPFIQQYQSQKENREARLLQAQIQREQIAAGKQILADERINKGYVDMTKRIEADIASARSAFGRSANVIRAAGAIEVLASKFKADELSYQEIQELAKSLDGMLAQGAPTITGTQKLVPTSFIGDWQKIASYLLNIPKGAKQGEFVKRMLATVGREKEYAKNQILKTQTELLSGYEHLKKADPDRWDRTLNAFGIPTDESSKQLSESSTEKKETVKLPKKQTGNAGKVIVSKDGKRYRINSDETTATEI
jgi:hypothetical protein